MRNQDDQRISRVSILIIAIHSVIALACRPADNAALASGATRTRPPQALGDFREPRVLARATDARFWVIDRRGDVQQFDPSGQLQAKWTMPGNSPYQGQPSGACYDDVAQRLLIADTHKSRVLGFGSDGSVCFELGRRGSGPGDLVLPSDVAVDRDGNIFVSEFGGNDRVLKFSPTGEFLLEFGDMTAGRAALQRPSGLAVDEAGRLWVADTGNHRVCLFTGSGQLLQTIGTVGSEPGCFRHPRDVAILPDGKLAVADSGNHRITIHDRSGRCISSVDHSDPAAQLCEPLNVVVDGPGIWVADSRNHRVVRLALPAASRDPELAARSDAQRKDRLP